MMAVMAYERYRQALVAELERRAQHKWQQQATNDPW